jgi:glycosyltransferase involved in cell wall biosynthesis
MSQSSPTISVIIPTYNGAHRISNTLNAIMNQSVSPDEVIVVIDGSTDSTEQIVEIYTQKFKKLKIVEQPNKGRAGVRNTGAKNATGEILIFYDDDTRPEPDSILRHRDFHRAHPNSICGGFPVEDEKLMKTDIQKYKLWLSKKWTAKYHEGLNLLASQNLFLTAANMSIPKALFDLLGGFDEKLTDAEDYELAVRAFQGGIPVYFDKSNIAWHDDFINCKQYINRRKEYKKASMKGNIEAIYKYGLWSKIDRFLFSLPFWVYLIDHTNILTLLPKKLRYGLYSLIIWRSAGY